MRNRLLKLLERHNAKVLAIICSTFGDSGKGKFADLVAEEWADIIIRGTGGANAGHTIWVNGQKHVVHMLPSGILHDKDGKVNIIGSGTAFDPYVFSKEQNTIRRSGGTFSNFYISHRAHLLLPQHKVMDRVRESNATEGKIGTTGQGIGPCYTDHYARIGLTANDLFNKDVFVWKLKRNLEDKIKLLRLVDPELVKYVMQHEDLESGEYYSARDIFNVDAIVNRYVMQHGLALNEYITDTDELVRKARGKQNILLEGAQGNLLSVDYGTYPYVTSTDCTVGNLAKGAGLREGDVDLTFAIAKAYMTRVGGGPFPTELGGERAAQWRSAPGMNRLREIAELGDVSINSDDEFEQGVALRIEGEEYGATTGRLRGVGWFCAATQRYSNRLNGRVFLMPITKLDVLSKFKRLKVCRALRYNGPDYRVGNLRIRKGHEFSELLPDSEVLRYCEPIYDEMPGWNCEIDKTDNKLPLETINYIRHIEQQTGASTGILSLGKDRNETYVM
jgi:adenylosuccinate synthase